MLEKLFDIIKKNWLNPKSIPFAFAFLFATYIILISKILEWNIFDLTGASLAIVVFFFFIVFLIYAVLCFIFRLPKAPKDTLAVLFIVDAENEQLYESAKFKLVNNFNASIEENNATQFKALCISKNTVPNFNLKKKM